ncbi:replicative helicase loader/inhibitor [Mahella australiensis]|uniref:Uncharacterized protein n=1 Tax=Mahella australiensis (strain DSM 15567 / CIP 107919 / 50-1 BON) TaxID=697281 RepID=F3ZVF9_MAHA5|nr:replicative helicase loader/inhibitor [Mahella australiensis]AEE95309.1 hypothetical protein Mahau_0086 [Mahella australiensis 50-1 BON]
MDVKEMARILAVIAAAYPKFGIDNSGITLNVWYSMLGDLPYQAVQAAVQRHILENPFPPSIADIRRLTVELLTPPDKRVDANDAWGQVVRAIRMYGIYRPQEALDSMAPDVAAVIKAMGWEEICLSDNLNVIRGQFLKLYERKTAAIQRERLLPDSLRAQIAALAETKAIEEG